MLTSIQLLKLLLLYLALLLKVTYLRLVLSLVNLPLLQKHLLNTKLLLDSYLPVLTLPINKEYQGNGLIKHALTTIGESLLILENKQYSTKKSMLRVLQLLILLQVSLMTMKFLDMLNAIQNKNSNTLWLLVPLDLTSHKL